MSKSKREKLIPYQRTHPGTILAHELDSRGITVDDFLKSLRPFSMQIEMPELMIEHMLAGNPYYHIHPSLAVHIEKQLGISADIWVNMTAQWELWYWRVINCQTCGVKMDSVLSIRKDCDNCYSSDDKKDDPA